MAYISGGIVPEVRNQSLVELNAKVPVGRR